MSDDIQEKLENLSIEGEENSLAHLKTGLEIVEELERQHFNGIKNGYQERLLVFIIKQIKRVMPYWTDSREDFIEDYSSRLVHTFPTLTKEVLEPELKKHITEELWNRRSEYFNEMLERYFKTGSFDE